MNTAIAFPSRDSFCGRVSGMREPADIRRRQLSSQFLFFASKQRDDRCDKSTFIKTKTHFVKADMNVSTREFDLRQWAEQTLVRAGAAQICQTHGEVFSGSNEGAVKRAVAVGRMNHLPNISADGAELAILETYISLEEVCPRCRV